MLNSIQPFVHALLTNTTNEKIFFQEFLKQTFQNVMENPRYSSTVIFSVGCMIVLTVSKGLINS